MSKASRRFVLFFNNFSGILCHKYVLNCFKLSPFLVGWNVVQLFLSTVLLLLMFCNQSIMNLCYKTDITSPIAFSSFSKFLIFFAGFMRNFLGNFLVCKNLLRRNRISNFLNACTEFKINKNSFLKIARRSMRNSCLIFIYYLVIFSSQIAYVINHTLLAFVVCFFVTLAYLAQLSFFVFMKNFEMFFVALLDDFREDLKLFLQKSRFERRIFKNLLSKYQKIYELNHEFNEVFGAQVTAQTCCLSMLMTLEVRNLNITPG